MIQVLVMVMVMVMVMVVVIDGETNASFNVRLAHRALQFAQRA